MDVCYIDDQTKTVFTLTEYGYAAFNPETTDFDNIIPRGEATKMIVRARVVSPSEGKDYGLEQMKRS